jgi:hypothetical protein
MTVCSARPFCALFLVALCLTACSGATPSDDDTRGGGDDMAAPAGDLATPPGADLAGTHPDLRRAPDLLALPDLVPAQPQSGQFSCDYVINNIHTCTDYAWTGGAYDASAIRDACMQRNATIGNGCDHTNSAGGCRTSSNFSGVTFTTTNWYYKPTYSAQLVMAACGNTTYVSP